MEQQINVPLALSLSLKSRFFLIFNVMILTSLQLKSCKTLQYNTKYICNIPSLEILRESINGYPLGIKLVLPAERGVVYRTS